jgi:hypothetical protein
MSLPQRATQVTDFRPEVISPTPFARHYQDMELL